MAVDRRRARLVRSTKSVIRKNVDAEEENLPQPLDLGQRDGTASWRAFREACSPGTVVSVPPQKYVYRSLAGMTINIGSVQH
jgi:hypothetical protein